MFDLDRRRAVALLVPVACTAAGCGSSAARPDALSGARPLEQAWTLSSASAEGVPSEGAELVMQLELDDAILSAQGPCHRLLGSFTVSSGGYATFTVPGTGTSSCDEGDLGVELALVEALETVDSWSIEDGLLTLSGGETALVFTDS